MNIWHDINPARITRSSFDAVIEISKGSKMKYELDKETGMLHLDRVLHTSTHYPANYGFIPRTYALDNDPLDVLVLCSEQIEPMALVKCYPIGVISMLDNGAPDDKIIAIPVGDPTYNGYSDISQLPKHVFDEMIHFFSVYKTLENKETESWIRLIRVLTHEIMNSVAPVSSLSETLLSLYRDADSTPEQLRANTIEAFETIQTTASGLLTFVESYRQFTSIPRPRKERIEGRALIEQLVKLHEPALRQRGIALTWQAEEDAHLMADRNLLMRVLVNLLKNAMEAPYPTADKHIRIRLEAKADGSATIDVADNGSPIPADVLANIFIPFFTTKPAGSGIGLSVSRYILLLHGGTLQHHLSPDGYTTFRITLEG